MIDYAGALFLVIGFIAILKIAGLVEKSTRVIAISKQAVAVLRDEGMSDDEKENLMQGHAKQLAGLFFLLTIGGLARPEVGLLTVSGGFVTLTPTGGTGAAAPFSFVRDDYLAIGPAPTTFDFNFDGVTTPGQLYFEVQRR